MSERWPVPYHGSFEISTSPGASWSGGKCVNSHCTVRGNVPMKDGIECCAWASSSPRLSEITHAKSWDSLRMVEKAARPRAADASSTADTRRCHRISSVMASNVSGSFIIPSFIAYFVPAPIASTHSHDDVAVGFHLRRTARRQQKRRFRFLDQRRPAQHRTDAEQASVVHRCLGKAAERAEVRCPRAFLRIVDRGGRCRSRP